MKKILLTLFLFLLPHVATAATYYVDTAGSNTNDGSIAHPFLTIQKGIDTATTPGDMVCVNDGTYAATFNKIGNPGTADNPITVRNCQGGTVMLDLGAKAGSWTSLGGNKYISSLNTFSQEIFYKDTSYLGAPISCGALSSNNQWCVGTGTKFEIYSTTNPSTDGSIYRGLNSAIRIKNTSYIVIDGISAEYAQFVYLVGDDTTTNRGATHHIEIKNLTVQYGGDRAIRVIGSNAYPATYMYVHHNTIHDAHDYSTGNGHCIKFDSNETGYHNSYAYAYNNNIYDCEATGIQFSNGWQHGFFYNNTITNTSTRVDGTYAAIRCGDTKDCNIYNNTLTGGTLHKGSGIYLNEFASPSHVYNNRVSGYNFYGIFIGSVSATTTADLHVYNNVSFFNSLGGIAAITCNGLYLTNNSFYGNGTPQISISGGVNGGTIRNNIVFSASNSQAISYAVGNHILEDHNLFFATSNSTPVKYGGTNYTLANYKTASGQGNGSLSIDPKYVSPGTGDYLLQAASPAINSGTSVVSELSVDFQGAIRPQGSGWDMGYYEYSIANYGVKGGAAVKGGGRLK